MGKFSVNSIRGNENGKVRLGEGLLNDASKGKSWAEKGVHLSQILKRNARTGEGSEELWKYSYEKFIMPNVKKGNIKED